MGIYLNPGNESYKAILKGIYVDKTDIIDVINQTIGTSDKLTCISKPRRFGKSYTAKMLCAYYDKTCLDSKELFDDKKISCCCTYAEHLGKYNVIYLDITSFLSDTDKTSEVVKKIKAAILNELVKEFNTVSENDSLVEALLKARIEDDTKFFFIIDEWDVLFREQKDESKLLEEYVSFLRDLFKNGNFTDRAIAGAFMTGILPIKKYGHQSAISDFREYTMIQPSIFSQYVGFVEADIDVLAKNYSCDREKLKTWYDGYSFPGAGAIYNPNSVCQAIRTGVYDTYWSKTETYTALLDYINMDTDGLQADLIQMIGGNEMPVDTSTFQNDMTSINGRNDVLSLLIHLGYLAYDNQSERVRIPNEEIRREFISTVRSGTHDVTTKIIKNSDQLIADTIDMNEEAVARAIQNAHDAGCFGVSPLFYNDEQALRSVVKFAYISSANNYLKIEELPSGHGYCDVAYIPVSGKHLPVLLIELKVNSSSEGALAQIKEKNYPKIFENVDNDIILCGISYDPKTKAHSCRIEKIKL